MSENALIQKIKPTVAASPHMKSGETSQTMMRDVIIALVPVWQLPYGFSDQEHL